MIQKIVSITGPPHSTKSVTTCPSTPVDEPLDNLWTSRPSLGTALCTACAQLVVMVGQGPYPAGITSSTAVEGEKAAPREQAIARRRCGSVSRTSRFLGGPTGMGLRHTHAARQTRGTAAVARPESRTCRFSRARAEMGIPDRHRQHAAQPRGARL